MRALLLACLLPLITAPAFADGTVFRANGCGDKMFVATADRYSMLVGGPPGIAQDGDRLVGDIDTFGFAQFYLPDSGRRFAASVEARGLSRSEVATRVATSCRVVGGERLTSGRVERAAGCGNKIFVSTNEGYAVLERLAGGVVSPGDTLTGNLGRIGRTTVKDHQTNAELVVFVDDFRLAVSAAQRKITESCK